MYLVPLASSCGTAAALHHCHQRPRRPLSSSTELQLQCHWAVREGAGALRKRGVWPARRPAPATPPGRTGEPSGEWEPDEGDWEQPQPSDSDDDVELFTQQDLRSPEFFLQNVIALALISLLGLSVGNIMLKLVFVTYALVSAAVRYTIIAFLVIVLFAIFT